jgi:acetyltransferase-like isoleucine patch superfamily enzyme
MIHNFFFTEAFRGLPPEEIENYHKAVFLGMDGEYAARIRLEYYSSVLRHMGKNVSIGAGVKMVNPQFISLGDNVHISGNCALIARADKGITMEDGSRLKHGVYLDTETPEGYITVGKHVYIGAGCCLHGHRGLEIGDHSLLAQNITITPYSHNFDDPDRTIFSQGGLTRKVSIGRDCYLGMCVSVLWSADIGDGAVVGSGSVVVKPVPPYSVAVGVPARVIKKRGQKSGE